jgi:hypothetical protein
MVFARAWRWKAFNSEIFTLCSLSQRGVEDSVAVDGFLQFTLVTEKDMVYTHIRQLCNKLSFAVPGIVRSPLLITKKQSQS